MFTCAERPENRPTQSDAVMSRNQKYLLVINTKCVCEGLCFMEFYASGTGPQSLCLRMTSRGADGCEGARHAVSCSTVN